MPLPLITDICTVIKKLFVTFFAVLYLAVSSGATLHYRYCMGKLINISLWHHGHEEKCGTCGMDRKEKAAKKCCTDQHQQLISEKSSSVSYAHVSLGASVALPINEPFWLFTSNPGSPGPERLIKQAPPNHAEVPVFLRNCTFRI